MKYLLILIVLFSSCSARYHIEKAKKKGAIIESDTIFQEFVTSTTVTDTVVQYRNRIFTDTVEIETVKWKTKTFIDTVENTIYQQVECKPDTIRVPVAINTDIDCPKKKFPWWLLLVGIGLGAGGILFLKVYLR